MNLTFKEKSLWLSLVILCLVFGNYFSRALDSQAANIAQDQVVLFIGSIITIVALQIIGHIAISLFDRKSVEDERDRLISLKGSETGHVILVIGVVGAMVSALRFEGNFVLVHILLAFWVLSQVVEIGVQLILYRRSA